jgi:hypothetical protein
MTGSCTKKCPFPKAVSMLEASDRDEEANRRTGRRVDKSPMKQLTKRPTNKVSSEVATNSARDKSWCFALSSAVPRALRFSRYIELMMRTNARRTIQHVEGAAGDGAFPFFGAASQMGSNGRPRKRAINLNVSLMTESTLSGKGNAQEAGDRRVTRGQRGTGLLPPSPQLLSARLDRNRRGLVPTSSRSRRARSRIKGVVLPLEISRPVPACASPGL